MSFSPPVKVHENANQKEIKEILMKNNENRKTRSEKKERK